MISLNKRTTLAEALREYPGLLDYLTRLSPHYNLLKNPTVRGLMAPRTSMAKVAQRGGMSFDELMVKLSAADDELRRGGAGTPDDSDRVKDEIKKIIKNLKTTEDVAPLKERFKELLRAANPVVIAAAEAELAQEGYSMKDLMSACEIHLELFRETLEKAKVDVPKDHPLWRLTKDHDAILFWLNRAQEIIGEASGKSGYEAAAGPLAELRQELAKLRETENHDTRQENTLFPVLERYGVEEPPAIMWEEHSRIKGMRREIEKSVAEAPAAEPYQDFIARLGRSFVALTEVFIQHSTKEQQILYQVALQLLSEADWREIKQESDELGYFELPREVSGDA